MSDNTVQRRVAVPVPPPPFPPGPGACLPKVRVNNTEYHFGTDRSRNLSVVCAVPAGTGCVSFEECRRNPLPVQAGPIGGGFGFGSSTQMWATNPVCTRINFNGNIDAYPARRTQNGWTCR